MISKMERQAAKRLKKLELRDNEQKRCLERHDDPIERELVDIIEFDAGELFDEHKNLKPLVDQPERVLKGVADVQFQFRRSGKCDNAGRPIIEVSYSLKFHDKLKALTQLGDHVGAFLE